MSRQERIRRDVEQLRALDGHTLSDIGLSHDRIEDVVCCQGSRPPRDRRISSHGSAVVPFD